MARVSYSPLIVDARGKVGDTVFSSWKGIGYIRSRVTPANPQSTAQTQVRQSMADCVEMWQSLEQEIKDAWDTYASPYGYSGFNAWVKANRADQQDGQLLQFTPINSDVSEVTNLSGTGGGSGEIDLTWTDPGQGAGYYAYIAYRKEVVTSWTLAEKATTLLSAEAYTITGLDAGATYHVAVAPEKTADDTFGKSDSDQAAAGT